MTKKSETDKAADQGVENEVTGEESEKAAKVEKGEKAPVRKTIRRVRKVATRKPKEDREDQDAKEDLKNEVVTPLLDVDAGEKEAKKKAPSKSSRTAKNERSESPRDEPRERKGDSDRPKRKIGRVRKDGGADNRGADGEEERRGNGDRRSRGRRSSRPKAEPVDAKALARKAWKLYQADIAEEGIALVDDKAGRHLALRSFDLARIFLEEKARQKRAAGGRKDKDSGKDTGKTDDSRNDDSGEE